MLLLLLLLKQVCLLCGLVLLEVCFGGFFVFWGVIWRLFLSLLKWVHCEISELKGVVCVEGWFYLRVCFGGFCFQRWHGWYGFVCFENWLYLKGYLEAFRFTFYMCWFWSLLIEFFFSCITCRLGVIWKYELIFFW